MSWIPPGQGMGRMYGEAPGRVTDDELERDAIEHEHAVEAVARRAPWWTRIFRRPKERER